MSCKLLLNLVECIRAKSEAENGNGRELLMRMLEVFVLKFKTIAKIQLPQILQKCKQQPQSPTQQTPTLTDAKQNVEVKVEAPKTPVEESKPPMTASLLADTATKDTDKAWTEKSLQNRFGVTPSQYSVYSVSDCRSLVKTLVCGVKTITWGIVSCKAVGAEAATVQNKQFLPKEALVYIRLVKFALQALDIYTINIGANGQAVIRPAVVQTVRTKEEKEVLEHFAGVIVANSFLANPTTSATFATILVDYLLARLEEMG
ncbi:transformation/transcription domain-associated protein-like, partial [Saccostrea cucullata]|uniref:transformation/transcription domain-associated protein-like n=1 Tax=Saccostrea cuccullata TaxID=36930 RepID=UPI002ED1FACC